MVDVIRININDEVEDTRDIIKSCFKNNERWICTVNDLNNVMKLKKSINKRNVQPLCFKKDFPIGNQVGNIYNTLVRTQRNAIMGNKTLCSLQQRFLDIIKDEEFALVMNVPDVPYYSYHLGDGDWKIFSMLQEDSGLKVLDNGIMKYDTVKYEKYGDYFTSLHDMIARKQVVYRGKTFYGYLNDEISSCFKKIYLLSSEKSEYDFNYWALPLEQKLEQTHFDEPAGKLFVWQQVEENADEH